MKACCHLINHRFSALVVVLFLIFNYWKSHATNDIETCDLLIKYIDEFYGIGIYAGKEFATGIYLLLTYHIHQINKHH
jgi:hypothetical protein